MLLTQKKTEKKRKKETAFKNKKHKKNLFQVIWIQVQSKYEIWNISEKY